MTQTQNTLESLSALSDVELDLMVAKMRGFTIQRTEGGSEEAGDHWVCYELLGSNNEEINEDYYLEEKGIDPWLHFHSDTFYPFPKPSTDANAALQLLDEMVEARFFDPTTVWSMHTQGTSIYEPDIPYRQEEHEIASANGKPSVALPRAITIAYILFKSQNA